MAWPVVGKSFTPAEFAEYVRGLKWDGAFRPTFVALHNTASPSLAQRPNGLTRQHIANLEAYYKGLGWSGGPHLFVDDKQIWVFNPLTQRGTHSPSWNSVALGVEMLGDYDCESFTSGRGRLVRDNAVAAVAVLNNVLGFAAKDFKFHIEDKKSDHACPGILARKERTTLIAEIAAAMRPHAAHVAEAEPESHIDTKAVNLADAEPAAADINPGDLESRTIRDATVLKIVGGVLGGGATATGVHEANVPPAPSVAPPVPDISLDTLGDQIGVLQKVMEGLGEAAKFAVAHYWIAGIVAGFALWYYGRRIIGFYIEDIRTGKRQPVFKLTKTLIGS